MSQSYRASYRLTRGEMLRSMEHHARNSPQRAIIVAGHIMALLFVAQALYLGLTSELNAVSLFALAMLLLFPLYWWLLRERVTRWMLTRNFKERADADGRVAWTLSPEGFRTEVEGVSATEAQWTLFTKAVETPDGFLLYPQRNTFFWLPFSAFEQPEAVERVREYLVASGVPFDRRTG